MNEKNDRTPSGLEKLFSTQIILLGIFVLGLYWVFFGEDNNTESARFNYTSQNIPIGVSDQINIEAIEKFGIDLTKDLDPKLIPSITSEALKETSQANISEKEFLPTLVSIISNKIRDISTIDLNEDGITDHILIVPQTENANGEYLVFSILVPDPSKVSLLPSATDKEGWEDIAKNKSIEIMTSSVIKSTEEQITMQSTPNPQMYNSSGTSYSPYYSSGYSMGSLFMTSMMMSMLFSPPYFWGGGFGYGYGYGGPMAVSSIQNRRGPNISRMKKASPTMSSAKTFRGKNVSSNKFRSTSKKSLTNLKTTKFRAANKKISGGGFGKNIKSQRKKSFSQRRTIPRRKFSFGGSRRRGGFGFGGFGRRRR